MSRPIALLLFVLCAAAAPAQEAADAWRQALERADAAAVPELVAEADRLGWEADDEAVAAAVEALPRVRGKELLFLSRFLHAAGVESDAARLVGLLDPADLELSRAALATLEGAVSDEEAADAARALGGWLLEHPVEDAPALWTEAQLALFRFGDATYRSAVLRQLRDLTGHEDPEVRKRALLALGLTGVALSPAEREGLEAIAAGADEEALLARAVLDRLEEKERYRQREEALLKRIQELGAGEDRVGAAPPPADDRAAAQMLRSVIRMIRRSHMEGDRFTPEELFEAAADGALSRLDPYSDFLTGEEVERFKFEMDPEYGGIGAYVNLVDGVFTIVRPIYSGPAYRAGLLSGDQILEVDGWSTIEQPLDETIRRLKGEPGTEVVLKVFRTGWREPREIPVVRERITVPVLQEEMLPGGILYLELLSFTETAAPAIVRAIRDASREGELRGVVLDLRNNPGGYLEAAVQISDAFLPAGALVVSTRSRAYPEEEFYAENPPLVSEDVPLVVLINRYSASASEIVSGALRAQGRATLVGERSHGKGSVQRLLRIPGVRDEPFDDQNRNGMRDEWEPYEDLNGNGRYDYAPIIKLTVAYYYLPDGSSIHTLRDHEGRVVHKGGVPPDVEASFPELDYLTLREIERLFDAEAFRTYARRILDENPALAVRLAQFDDHDTSLYPDWDAFYASLETPLSEQEVRRWVRRRLRELVSDQRGKVFPGNGFYGDFEEDPQLQAAIRVLLDRAGVAVDSIHEYEDVFAHADEAGGTTDADEPADG